MILPDPLLLLAEEGRREGARNREQPRSHDNSRIAWAKHIAKIAEDFPLACPACGGDIRSVRTFRPTVGFEAGLRAGGKLPLRPTPSAPGGTPSDASTGPWATPTPGQRPPVTRESLVEPPLTALSFDSTLLTR